MANETPVPQEQVLAQLRTRGFEDGFQRTPLRHFKGKLDKIGGHMIDRFAPPRLEVIYTFSEMEVIDSTEPYLAPIADLTILHSSRKKSAMGYLGASIDKIINAGLPADAPASQVKGQDFLMGKILEMKMTPGHMIFSREAKEDRPQDCWEVIGVEGFTSPVSAPAISQAAAGASQAAPKSAVQEALTLLDGKTEQQWNQAIFNSPIIKADANLINLILQRQFLSSLETVGTVIKDGDGIYHVHR